VDHVLGISVVQSVRWHCLGSMWCLCYQKFVCYTSRKSNKTWKITYLL